MGPKKEFDEQAPEIIQQQAEANRKTNINTGSYKTPYILTIGHKAVEWFANSKIHNVSAVFRVLLGIILFVALSLLFSFVELPMLIPILVIFAVLIVFGVMIGVVLCGKRPILMWCSFAPFGVLYSWYSYVIGIHVKVIQIAIPDYGPVTWELSVVFFGFLLLYFHAVLGTSLAVCIWWRTRQKQTVLGDQ